MRRHYLRTLLGLSVILAVALGCATPARAAGGSYEIEGATAKERGQVRAALDASAFDWDVIPTPVTIHVARGVDSQAQPGHIWLDSDLLRAGIFSWAVVQDEYAHQVDFLLFDDAVRATLNAALGGKAWCQSSQSGLRHSEYGCERFASMLVWAYWPSRSNAYRPKSSKDEAATMAPARFRALVQGVVTQRIAFFAAQ